MNATMKKSTILGTLAAAVLGAGMLAAPTAASAKPLYWKGKYMHHHHHKGWHGKHYGWGAAGIGAGLALGAIAASAYAQPAYAAECYTVRRRVVNEFGDVYIRRVRVCD